jgi:thymidylate kinase
MMAGSTLHAGLPMSIKRPVIRLPDGKEPQCWDELTDTQKRVVSWMVDNEKDHRAVIAERVTNGVAVYQRWGVDNLYKWADWYKATKPPPPPDPVALIEAALPVLTERALQLLRETLEAGEGNATAVRAAQWTLDKAYEFAKAQPKTEGTKQAMAELEAVLRVVS